MQNAGNELRSAIIDRYNKLHEARKIQINREGNEITDIAQKFIPVGLNFDAAERLLAKAGFEIGKRPGLNVSGDRPDRYDLRASSEDMINPHIIGFGVEVVILLRPKSPGDYSEIASIIAYINAKSL